MRGKVDSGQLCTVEPVDRAGLQVGDVVLCKVNGRHYLHLIRALQGGRFQIGNNPGPGQRLGVGPLPLRPMRPGGVRTWPPHSRGAPPDPPGPARVLAQALPAAGALFALPPPHLAARAPGVFRVGPWSARA
jgi:hypothetical protein